MHVLLATLNAKYIHLNLAIRLLYELNKHDQRIEFQEFTIKEDRDEIARFCQRFDLVAFSCYIWNITQTLEVARKIKALNPSVKILLGGPEVSYDWQDVIAREEVDFIITGEGEIPFRAFLESWPDVDGVPNLVRKVDGEVSYFPQTTVFPLENYRSVMPYGNDPLDELPNKVLYLETSRGCPYKCEFCLASLDNKVRYLPMETIKNTLLFMMQNGRTIKFLDRTFNIKRDFTIEIFKFILDNHRPGNVFQFEITADILHPDIINFIQNSIPRGLLRFEIGIQTVNQKANLEVSRKQNFEKTKQVVLALRDHVEMHLDLIVGLALDYWEDVKFSFEEVFKLYPPELQLGFLKFLKGTPVRHKFEQHGFVFDPAPPYQIIESNYLSRDELKKIELLEHALEIYWNKNRATRTLRYVTERYSIFDFLLGLGEAFAERHDLHKFGLSDIFETLFQFARDNYPDDRILIEMIAIEYCLHHKIKPRSLYLDEIPAAEKQVLLADLDLNPHKFRHIVLPLSFDFELFEKEGTIEKNESVIIIQYSGTAAPKLYFSEIIAL